MEEAAADAESPYSSHAYTLVKILALVSVCAMMLTGILGNAVIVYIYKTRLKTTSHNCLVQVLAVCDLLVCCVAMPSAFRELLAHAPTSGLLCKYTSFVLCFGRTAGMCTLLAIAGNRYQKVFGYKNRRVRLSTFRALALALVVTAAAVAAPALHLYDIPDSDTGKRTEGCPRRACAVPTSGGVTALVYFCSLLTLAVLCSCAMAAFYLLIWLRLLWLAAPPADHSRKNLAVTLLLSAVFYAISFLPSVSISVADRLVRLGGGGGAVTVLYRMGRHSYFLSSAINPMIYGYRNHAFRAQLKMMLSKMRDNLLSKLGARKGEKKAESTGYLGNLSF